MKRGRPEQPIVGFGPVAGFAAELRAVRRAAGATYPRMGERVGCSAAALSQAANGRQLPSFRTLHRYLRACGVDDPDVLATWDVRLHVAEQAARAFAPDLGHQTTVDGLTTALVQLVEAQALAPVELSRRLSSKLGAQVGRLTVEPLPPREIAEVLQTRSVPLTARTLGNLVFAAGGTAADVEHWQTHLRRLRVTHRAAPASAPRAAAWQRHGRLPGAGPGRYTLFIGHPGTENLD